MLAHGDAERALGHIARRGLREPAALVGLAELLTRARDALATARLHLAAADAGEVEPAERARLAALVRDLDALTAQLAAARAAGDAGRVDAERAEALLGDGARRALDRLRQLALVLAEAGLVQLVDGRAALTPMAARRLGRLALRDLFARLRRDRAGQHAAGAGGAGVEMTEASRPYHFGDPMLLDLQGTLRRALSREGIGTPLRLRPGDFAVHQTEPRVRSATALLIDVSRSMLLGGCFAAAKGVALALATLIEGRFRHDHLSIIAFAHTARLVAPPALAALAVDEREYGTNLHAALRLARARLRRQPGRNKQIIVITDGEPTAHLRDEGGIFFAYPPTPRTIEATLREVDQCAREQIVVNTFMLERGQHLTDFVGRLTRLNRGRAFFVTPERLGEYVLLDHVGRSRTLTRR